MAFSWAGFRDAYVADKERRREDEINLQRKAEALLPALMERRNRETELARNLSTKLGYLETRGVAPETLNALAANPEYLDAVFQETTAGKWLDYDSDQLNTRVRSVGAEAEVGGGDWRESVARVNSAYEGLDLQTWDQDNLESWNEYLYSPSPTMGSGVVEIRRETTPDFRGTEYEFQQEVFDEKVTELAYRRLSEMGETAEAEQLRQKLVTYKDNPQSRVAIRDMFGPMVIDYLESSPQFADSMVGFRNNPLIFGPEGGFSDAQGTQQGADIESSPVGTVVVAENGKRYRKVEGGWEEL